MAGWRHTLDVLGSYAASAARLGVGLSVAQLGPRPAQPIEVFEFEACPYSRKVREAMTVLDLDAIIRPCPLDGQRYRPTLPQRGGRLFPQIIDPSTGVEMGESADIVAYLFDQYGAGPVPMLLRGRLSMATSVAATVARAARGRFARPSAEPEQLLELWGFEGSPYVRLVREVLCSLEIAYVSRSVAKGSPKRPDFVERSGKMQVPFLIDPNTGTEMFESADIVDYLEQTYAIT